MPSEFRLEDEEVVEVKDRTKMIWLGVAGALVVMLFMLWYSGRPDLKSSYVRASHILISAEAGNPDSGARALELINRLRQQIQDGESFKSLARQYSQDPQSASRGGDLGISNRGDYSTNFDEYCWNAPLNQLSDVIQTEHGYHLIIVNERHFSDEELYEREIAERARKSEVPGQDPDEVVDFGEILGGDDAEQGTEGASGSE